MKWYWIAALLGGGWWIMSKKAKAEIDTYRERPGPEPPEPRRAPMPGELASPHFTWDELLVSATAPNVARKYREEYPDGSWPIFNDPVLLQAAYPGRNWNILMRKMRPELLRQTLADNMRDHLNDLVEPLRAHLGVPLRCISGWRPPELNQAVGGAKSGSHMMAIATDFKASPNVVLKAKLWALDRKRNVGDIGLFLTYSWGFHISSLRGFSDGVIK